MTRVDAHTHKVKDGIPHLFIVDMKNIPQVLPANFAMGIHPWYLEDLSIAKLKSMIKKYNCQILGECGIDKAINTPIQDQVEVFENQIKLAQQMNIEKIVVHCVRTFNEIYLSLKQLNFRGKIMLHDFNGNAEIINQFSQTFETYFSLGPSFLKENAKTRKSLLHIPKNRLLFESDDTELLVLDQIYEQAIEILNISDQDITQLISKNFNEFIN